MLPFDTASVVTLGVAATLLGVAVRRGPTPVRLSLILVSGGTLVLLAGVRRLPVSYSLFAAPQVLLILLHENYVTPLTGTLRYALVIFPVFVVLAGWGLRSRRLHYSWLILSLALLGVLLYAFLTGPFVA